MGWKSSQELPENLMGQIKIDLSKREYEVQSMTVDRGKPRSRLRKRKNPNLSSIISVLESTGAKVLRVFVEKKFTIIDYIS